MIRLIVQQTTINLTITHMSETGKDWLKQPKVYKECPKCHRNDLDTRIKRGIFVKHILFWLPYKRYQCGNCAAKVYVLEKHSIEKHVN
jgi:hypothetical protein